MKILFPQHLFQSLFTAAVLTVELEGFTGGFAAAVCTLRTDGDVACHTAAVSAVVFTVLDRTMDMLDFFLFHY